MPYLLKISYLAAERGDYKKRPIGDPLSSFFAERGATVIVKSVHAPEIDFGSSDYLQNIVDLLWLAKKTGFDELQLSLNSEPCARIVRGNKERLEKEIGFAEVSLGQDSGSCATLVAKLKNISGGNDLGIGNMTDEEFSDMIDEVSSEISTNKKSDFFDLMPTEQKKKFDEIFQSLGEIFPKNKE